MQATHKQIAFRTEYDKAVYLDQKASEDSTDELVRSLALRFAATASALAAAQAIHRFVRDRVVYQRDPAGEQFASARVVIERGWDDCDGKARTVVALVRAVARLRPDWELEAKIAPHWRSGHFAHVSAHIRFLGSHVHPRADKAGGWLESDTIVKGLELGQQPDEARDRATGRIPLA